MNIWIIICTYQTISIMRHCSGSDKTLLLGKKEHLTENELEVQREIEETLELCPHLKRPKSVLSYKFLERMMRVMDNPDFFAGLPSQTAEECQKAAVHDFRSWLASLRKYKKHPEKYLGKPKMPHYKKKRSISTITFSNQGCKIKEGDILRFALTKETIHLPYRPEGRLKEVKVKPYYGDLLLVCTFECPDPEEKVKGSGVCAIDLGVENIAAIVSSKGDCWLYKGGVLKEKNQWYNKQLAKLRSIAMKGHDPKEASKDGIIEHKTDAKFTSEERSVLPRCDAQDQFQDRSGMYGSRDHYDRDRSQ